MSTPTRILLLGATQGVGQALLPSLLALADDHPLEIHAISRYPKPPEIEGTESLHWHRHDLLEGPWPQSADLIISLGPIAFAQEALAAAPLAAVKSMWVLSSASPDFKSDSTNLKERVLMEAIAQAEETLANTTQANDIACQVLKTTLLYGRDDSNVNRLAQLIENWVRVPVFGSGSRAPVHVDDVAQLICRGIQDYLKGTAVQQGVWRLQGGEVLSYPDFLQRIASARGLPFYCVKCPQWMGYVGLALAHAVGRLRDINPEMLRRQDQDLTVDDGPARRDLAWHPRFFQP